MATHARAPVLSERGEKRMALRFRQSSGVEKSKLPIWIGVGDIGRKRHSFVRCPPTDCRCISRWIDGRLLSLLVLCRYVSSHTAWPSTRWFRCMCEERQRNQRDAQEALAA